MTPLVSCFADGLSIVTRILFFNVYITLYLFEKESSTILKDPRFKQ